MSNLSCLAVLTKWKSLNRKATHRLCSLWTVVGTSEFFNPPHSKCNKLLNADHRRGEDNQNYTPRKCNDHFTWTEYKLDPASVPIDLYCNALWPLRNEEKCVSDASLMSWLFGTESIRDNLLRMRILDQCLFEVEGHDDHVLPFL